MKSVLISIQPKWCELIASGKKTIEVRKTRPKIETPFKVYIYCTKDKNNTFWSSKKYSYVDDHSHNAFDKVLNGKVIGEFVCNKIVEAHCGNYLDLGEETCLYAVDLINYGRGNILYGWHISDLVIYDKPKELSEFTGLRKTKFGYEPIKITRPPQSWMYCEELSE